MYDHTVVYVVPDVYLSRCVNAVKITMSAVALGSLTRRLARISLAQAFPSMAACKALAGSNEQQCRFKSGGKGKKTVVKTTTKRVSQWTTET
jgi:hypothetical protein